MTYDERLEVVKALSVCMNDRIRELLYQDKMAEWSLSHPEKIDRFWEIWAQWDKALEDFMQGAIAEDSELTDMPVTGPGWEATGQGFFPEESLRDKTREVYCALAAL